MVVVFELSRRPIARLIGGSGGKSDKRLGHWVNLRWGENNNRM